MPSLRAEPGLPGTASVTEETPEATKPSRKWVSAVPRPVIWGFVGAVLVSALMSLRGLGAGLALGAAAGCTGNQEGPISRSG